MKTPILFVLFSGLLIISCKKKNPVPIPKAIHSLKHSGMVDLNSFTLNTSSVTNQLTQMYEWDYNYTIKEFQIKTWLKGPYLTDSIFVGEERLTLDFLLRLHYNISDYNSNCNCFPTPSSNRLANLINNSNYEWNDTAVRKAVIITVQNNQFSNASFDVFNPHIFAKAIGNSIRIHGTIDSLKVGSLSDNRYLRNLTFDYTVPINP